MITKEIKKHNIVQVVPDHKWGGCFVYVTEVKDWGVQGFTSIPMQGSAYIRLKNDEYVKVGEAAFRVIEEDEE